MPQENKAIAYSETPEKQLALLIFAARKGASLTQAGLGAKIFVTQQVVSDYENAVYPPDPIMLGRIARATGKPFGYFEV